MTSTTKLITVIGATGQQGNSIAKSLLQNPSFRVRGVTRNPDSSLSSELKALGAEVVKADLFNNAELVAAFDGAWGAYINTNSHDPAFKQGDGRTELDQGKAILDAAAQAGIKHVVYSSGPPSKELTAGKLDRNVGRSIMMESKFATERYAVSLHKFESVVPVVVGWYLENFLLREIAPAIGGFPFFPDSEDYLTIRMPHWGSADGKTGDNRVPFISVTDDLGDIVHGVFLDPCSWNERVVPIGGDMVTWGDVAEEFAEVTGKKARFEPVLPDWQAFETHGEGVLEGVKGLLAFTQTTGGLYFGRDKSEIETSAVLKRKVAQLLGKPEDEQKLTTAKSWIKKHLV